MTELIKTFIGKKCIIYTLNYSSEQILGTIEEISGDWIRITNNSGATDILNAEYITRITEYPAKKKKKAEAGV